MSLRNWLSAACIFLAGVSAAALAADERGSPENHQKLLDTIVASGVPGIVLQMSDGSGTWTGAAGYRDVEEELLLRTRHTFPVFSITKTFTAVVILQLIDEGQLEFDDTLGEILSLESGAGPVGKIPYSPDITIRQLLNHSSGIFDFANSMEYLQETVGENASYSKEWTLEEKLAFAHGGRNEPEGMPGTVVSYSSTGYMILGIVIERLTNQPLGDVFHQRIVEPLDLADTYLQSYAQWDPPDVVGYVMMNDAIREMRLATSFSAVSGDLVNATRGQRSRQGHGSGEDGIVSSARSLSKFASAIFDGTLLSPEMRREMLAPFYQSPTAFDQPLEMLGPGLRILFQDGQVWALMVGDGAGGEAIVGHELNSGRSFVALTNVFGAGVVDWVLEEMQKSVADIP